IKTVAPEGCIVNPRPPAACAARALMGWRMLDALFGALGKILPDAAPAAGEGGGAFPVIPRRHTGKALRCTATLARGRGGRRWRVLAVRCAGVTASTASPIPAATAPTSPWR